MNLYAWCFLVNAATALFMAGYVVATAVTAVRDQMFWRMLPPWLLCVVAALLNAAVALAWLPRATF